jgi:hypothetical protein
MKTGRNKVCGNDDPPPDHRKVASSKQVACYLKGQFNITSDLFKITDDFCDNIVWKYIRTNIGLIKHKSKIHL